MQKYENLELIVTDDASINFDKNAVQNYIDTNKAANLKNHIILTRDRNVGTVKNLNSAIGVASGYYITVFAGDDCLFDEDTLSNYEKDFTKSSERGIVTAQCYRYDSELKEFLYKQVSIERAYQINESPGPVQFKMLSEMNTFAMGATAFKKEILEKHQFFDERYKLIEDWSLFLKLTRNGERFHYADFVALKHRFGGLSMRKSRENSYALSSRDFCLDLLAVFENEIFPYMRDLSREERKQRVERYLGFVTANKDLLSGTIYDRADKVKLRFFLKYPVTAVKLYLATA